MVFHIGAQTRGSAQHATKPFVRFGIAKYLHQVATPNLNERRWLCFRCSCHSLWSVQHQPCHCQMSHRLSNKFCTFSFVFAKIRMSAAKREASKRGIASPRSTPPCGFASLHSDITNSSAAQNNRGLNTHPCRTPEQKSNVLPSPAP